MNLDILNFNLFDKFKNKSISFRPLELLKDTNRTELPVDYFAFYNSVSSVYSSKIEGENIDFDSYFKHKFLKIKFKPDYTRKADDLFSAYEFAANHKLTLDNVKKAHSILSQNLLPENQQGLIRNNLMFVINNDDRIEYVAAPPEIENLELQHLFSDINVLLEEDLDIYEIFYFASFIHLVFVKIHPFQDGNGRCARLLEKWFLCEKIGKNAHSIQLEKNYYKNLDAYYQNIRKLGLEYESIDYTKALDFLLMTIQGLK